MFRKKWQLTLTIAFACLGLLISLQFRAHQAMDNDLNSQNSETLAAIAKSLNTKYYQLIQEVWDLRSQLRLLEQNDGQNKTAKEAMDREKQKLDIAVGDSPVEGPGLIITIPEYDQNYFGYQNIIDIVNELWNAGAEAISVNDYRITAHSSLMPTEELSAITVNGHIITYPYIIRAIGEPASLEKGISIANGIIDDLKNLYKIPLEIKQVDKMRLPAAAAPTFKYARSVTNQASD